jgi:hypothetical protein
MTQQMMQQITGAFFKQQESSDKDLSAQGGLYMPDPSSNHLTSMTYRLSATTITRRIRSVPQTGLFLNRKSARSSFSSQGPHATESDGRRVFDRAAHRWIFVHEMGHWWQACRKVNFDQKSLWDRVRRQPNCPRLLAHSGSHSHGHHDACLRECISSRTQSCPCRPESRSVLQCELSGVGPGPAYPWFQSHMVDAAAKEKPAPSFATVLAETK